MSSQEDASHRNSAQEDMCGVFGLELANPRVFPTAPTNFSQTIVEHERPKSVQDGLRRNSGLLPRM